MVEVIRQENRALAGLLELAEQWTDPLAVQVHSLVGFYFAYLQTHVDSARISQCALDEAARNPEVAQIMREGEVVFCGFMERLFERAKARGELRADLDSAATARVSMSVIEGVKTNYLHYPGWPWAAMLPQVQGMLIQGLLGLPEVP
jgi:hypothetical protein